MAIFATSTASGVVDTGGNFATGVNDTNGKFAARVNNTQIMGIISDCWHLKVNLKEKKLSYMLTLLRGMGETNSWETPEIKNLVPVSL